MGSEVRVGPTETWRHKKLKKSVWMLSKMVLQLRRVRGRWEEGRSGDVDGGVGTSSLVLRCREGGSTSSLQVAAAAVPTRPTTVVSPASLQMEPFCSSRQLVLLQVGWSWASEDPVGQQEALG